MFSKKLLLLFGTFLFTFTLLHAKHLRILPLGDSITYDNNHNDDEVKPRSYTKRYSYRGYLWKMLKDSKIDFEFVGTRQAGQDFAPDFDPHNDGYPGEDSFEIADRTQQILFKTDPNIILLHVGTNDIGAKMEGVNEILDWVDTYELDNNTEIRVFVALIIDRREHDNSIKLFNENLKKLIDRRWKKGDMLTLVDMYHDAGLTKNDYIDRTHPNPNGYAKMAKVWFNAIRTPYVPFSTAPFTKDDKIQAQTGTTVSINVLSNDKDYQNDMDIASVKFSNNSSKMTIKTEGTWSVNSSGIVTFKPNKNFYSDPTPMQYTVKDKEGTQSLPATITIDYNNASLETYPTTVLPKEYIESIDVDESTNSVTFITRVPNTGITF